MFKFIFLGRKPHDPIIERFLLRNIKRGTRVIDVGCGTGTTALLLANNKKNCRVDGVEINQTKIHLANKLFLKAKQDHLVHCHFCGVENLTSHFGGPVLDCVTANHSTHHFKDVPEAINNMKSILKFGGKLLISDLTQAYGAKVDDCRRFSLDELKNFVIKAGFKIRSFKVHESGVITILAVKES